MTNEQNRESVEIFEIKIKGHLDTRWSERLYGLTITHERNNTTTLRGPLPDQMVLHSVLDRIRDMNLRLISVNLIGSDGQPVNSGEVKGVSTDISSGAGCGS